MIQTNYWNETIIQPLRTVLQRFWDFITNNLLLMVAVFIVGLIIAWIVKQILHLLLKIFKFDRFCRRVGLADGLQKIGISRTPSAALSRFVFWILFLSFLMFSLDILEIAPLTGLTSQFFLFIPNLIAGLLILLLGYFVSGFIHRAVLLAAVNAHIKHARILAGGAYLIVFFFFIGIAVEQIGIGRHIVMAAFTVILACIGLAMAIAIGLGGKDIAKDLLERYVKEDSPKEKDEITHL